MTPRIIAFYLPQFHPVPENDAWWGKGFTEWTNVTKARPLFPGHDQPRLPADLGFYDLRLPEIREAQANLAHEYGIHGFCYYHYWFTGRRILERPFNEVLASGKPDFPFCLCWANENWTRAWDGGEEREVLLPQHYSDEDDLAHIQSLIPAFRDPRYIRIDGRPLFLVYRTENLPDAARTAQIWRQEARLAGVGEIYLARVESFRSGINPADIGFDAAVEFAPDWRTLDQFLFRTPLFRKACAWGLLPQTYLTQSISDYNHLVQRMLDKPRPVWKRFRCVTPGFDNSARRPEKSAAIYVGSTPERYGQWLQRLLVDAMRDHGENERIVFVNAWDEWAEGNYLEPARRTGKAYLESTRQALDACLRADKPSGPTPSTREAPNQAQPSWLKQMYWSLSRKAHSYLQIWNHLRYWHGRRLAATAEAREMRQP